MWCNHVNHHNITFQKCALHHQLIQIRLINIWRPKQVRIVRGNTRIRLFGFTSTLKMRTKQELPLLYVLFKISWRMGCGKSKESVDEQKIVVAAADDVSDERQKVIVVFGSTGQQGGSVVRAMKDDKNFIIKAATRNTNSDKAKELTEAGKYREFRMSWISNSK